jgi:putative sterol carrier protein
VPIAFPSDEWIKALGEKLNASPSYAQSAKNWEGDFFFIVEAAGDSPEVLLYMDLWHGKCRDACAISSRAERNPEFVISAQAANWRKVIEGQLDPIKGLMARQLKLTGNMGKVMRAPQAAKELVACCSQIETSF